MKKWFANILLCIKNTWNKYVLVDVQLSSSTKEIQEKYIKQRERTKIGHYIQKEHL